MHLYLWLDGYSGGTLSEAILWAGAGWLQTPAFVLLSQWLQRTHKTPLANLQRFKWLSRSNLAPQHRSRIWGGESSELVTLPYQCASLSCAHAFQYVKGFKTITLHSSFQFFLKHFTKENLDIGRFVLNVKALNKTCAKKKRCWKWTFMLEMMMSE